MYEDRTAHAYKKGCKNPKTFYRIVLCAGLNMPVRVTFDQMKYYQLSVIIDISNLSLVFLQLRLLDYVI